MTVLETFAARLAALDPAALTAEAADALRRHAVDAVGATLVGSATPDGQAVLAARRGSSHLALAGDGPLENAAAAVAVTRLTEIDDIHLPSCTTPGAIVVPTAIVMAKGLGVTDASRFAAALLAGYEAMTRLGEAVGGASIVYRGIWPTALTAPVAAAALTTRLLGLDPERTAHALAIAMTAMGGRVGQPGPAPTARWLSAGLAARAGCWAALTAADGFNGDLSLLDGDWLTRTHGLSGDTVRLKPADGKPAVAELSLKPYCSAKQVIAAITAFEEVLGRGIDPAEIETVKVSVPDAYRRMIDHGVTAGNRLSSLTSAPYQLAVAAFAPEALFDVVRDIPAPSGVIASLMGKVSVSADATLGPHMPARWPARVEVRTSGRVETATVVSAPGDPGSAYDTAAASGKFHRFVDLLIGEDAAATWIEAATAAIDDGGALAALCDSYTATVRG